MTTVKIYQIEPLRADFLQRVRTTGIDDLGQSVEYLEAAGGEPCRDVLRSAKTGEKLILASYSPFTKSGPYREYGPVFILASPDLASLASQTIPTEGEFAYLRNTVALRAYSADERIVSARLSPVDEIEKNVEDLLQSAPIKAVHIRFGAYGCFACKLTLKEDEESIF